jgi:hypothetical protein
MATSAPHWLLNPEKSKEADFAGLPIPTLRQAYSSISQWINYLVVVLFEERQYSPIQQQIDCVTKAILQQFNSIGILEPNPIEIDTMEQEIIDMIEQQIKQTPFAMDLYKHQAKT